MQRRGKPCADVGATRQRKECHDHLSDLSKPSFRGHVAGNQAMRLHSANGARAASSERPSGEPGAADLYKRLANARFRSSALTDARAACAAASVPNAEWRSSMPARYNRLLAITCLATLLAVSVVGFTEEKSLHERADMP
jgi:hypothetical protein